LPVALQRMRLASRLEAVTVIFNGYYKPITTDFLTDASWF
jgi:hypothetical protein